VERSVERVWQKMMEREREVAERDGAESGLNRPLAARSNLTFHSTHFITCPH